MSNTYFAGGAPRPMPEGQDRATKLRGEKESPKIGSTLIDIEEMTLRIATSHGDVLGIRGKVVSSDCHDVGTSVEHAFFLSRPRYREAPTEAELAVYFIMQCRGCTLEQASATFNDLVAKLKTQPRAPWFRGVRVKADARKNSTGTFTNITWQHVPQSKEDIATRRAALDANTPAQPAAPVSTPPAAPQPPAVAVAAATSAPSMLDDL